MHNSPVKRLVIHGTLAAAMLVIAACASQPRQAARSVGFAVVAVSDPQDRPLQVAIWYPADAAPEWLDMGLSRQHVARGAPVAGRDLPLIVISHGTGGGFVSHADTAIALASAGFVVAAPNHTGDNYGDDSYVGTRRWLTDRPRHIRRVVDYMRAEWRDHARLDGRVGIFGFSAGAFTALVAIGGVPDLTRIAAHCRQARELACTLWKEPGSGPPPAWVHDPRISAAVVAAPGLGFSFAPEGLAHLTASVQLWSAADDAVVPYASNTGVVRRLMPSPPEYHDVPRAGHMSFITPCAPGGPPPICADAEGFDRAAFHDALNRAAIAFYRAHLQPR